MPEAPASRGPRTLPVRRYLLAVPVGALLFMALSLVVERETFFSLFKMFDPPASPDPAASRPAQALVERCNRAIEAAYRQGGPSPLGQVPMAAELREELARAVTYARARREPPLRLASQAFIRVEPLPGGAGWTLETDEVWVWDAAQGTPAGRSRLRFRFRLAEAGGSLRLEEMTPILPEPSRAR